MNPVGVSIRKLNKVYVPYAGTKDYSREVLTLNANMMRLGYMMSKDLFDKMSTISKTKIEELGKDIINTLKELKGDDVSYIPMYPNFPKQVMESTEFELYFNAILHYWTFGYWKPEYEKEIRAFAVESINYREIGVATLEDYKNIFSMVAQSNESISAYDKKVLEFFLNKEVNFNIPEVIPHKENMCVIAGMLMNKGKDITPFVKTATDVLRICTYLSDGDISLATNTKFKSLPRKQRKYLVGILENVITEEDIKRHKNKWVKLAHNLHVGDYSDKVYDIVNKPRENKPMHNIYTDIEQYIKNGEYVKASGLLTKRPGDFARKLDYLLRSVPTKDARLIADKFFDVIDRVSTRVLMQLLGHFRGRDADRKRVVFPKGNVNKAQFIKPLGEEISNEIINSIIDDIILTLITRFKSFKDLGRVYIDSAMKECPVPAQMRSASNAIDVVGRGTRIPMTDDKNTIRLFIYWVGLDIDLSASFHADNFDYMGYVSWTALRDGEGEDCLSCHSGDITRAPNGASEFIDVDIEKALNKGYRYIVMNVFVYTGELFSEHETCYAGWMMRSNPNSNEIYDPATVENKLDLTMDSRNAIPVVFDLQERKVIWVDLATHHSTQVNGNSVESNKANINNVLEAVCTLDNKPTLYDLFSIHGTARGEVVTDREDADIVFAWDGDITPKDISVINSEYLK